MNETNHTSIVSNIRRIYEWRMFSPLNYLFILVILWIITPVSELVRPVMIDLSSTALSDVKDTYITTTITDLHFTGYTQNFLGRTSGYYYYSFQKDGCILVLLTPHTCEEGLPEMETVTIRGQLIKEFDDYNTLTENLANDLHWTSSGIRKTVMPCLLSESDYHPVISVCLLWFYLVTASYAVLQILTSILYIRFPLLSPTCRELGLYGNAGRLLAQAEEELANLPQLATEDMYITEHFFIVFASHRVAVVPIQEIVWIYKHSTLHKFLWYHFSISYTLHITANRHLYIQCPKNMKSDIDGIIDYLSEANHDILVGFSEENRRKVMEMPGMARLSRKFI